MVYFGVEARAAGEKVGWAVVPVEGVVDVT